MSNPDEAIRSALIKYVLGNHISSFNADNIPLDKSLVELGVLDSFGVVELVSFIESNWGLQIMDSEITREKMGSIEKMVRLIHEKTESA